jgi:hypothetical protein
MGSRALVSANPFVTWALAPIAPDTRVAVVAGPGADPADVELVAAEIAEVVHRPLGTPDAAALIVVAHRGPPPEIRSTERDGWHEVGRIATWSVADRAVSVVSVPSLRADRMQRRAAHVLRSATVRSRGARRRWRA